jgi:hypothetical protein
MKKVGDYEELDLCSTERLGAVNCEDSQEDKGL